LHIERDLKASTARGLSKFALCQSGILVPGADAVVDRGPAD
jgi:hypothetical protein